MSISPPPPYEQVLDENRLAAMDNVNNHTTIQHPLMPNADEENDDEKCDDSYSNKNDLTEQGDSYSYLNSNMATTPSPENFIDCTGSSDPLFGSQHSGSHNELHHEGNCMEGNESDDEGGNCSRVEWSNQNQTVNYSPNEINEYIDNKSSKEMYKAAAKEWGISCKMSDGCRCMECQSHYFDCEYDDVSINIFS